MRPQNSETETEVKTKSCETGTKKVVLIPHGFVVSKTLTSLLSGPAFVEHTCTSLVVSVPGRSVSSAIEMTVLLLLK